MAYDPLDADSDCFRPPEIPTLVFCLHCRQEYDSYRIEWRIETKADGTQQGFWCCPMPGCGGVGFGCDILPVDRNYRDERGGWCRDDEEEDESEEFDAPPFGESSDDAPDGDETLPW